MMRRSALLLAAGALVSAVAGCATDHLGDLSDSLKSALAGTPVDVTEQNDSVLLTSSSDYMFPSGGWQIPSGSPVLNRMVPILSNLHNTKIVVSGYTDNVPVGAQLQRAGIANNVDLSTKRAESVVNYLATHGVNRGLLSAHGYGEAHPIVSNDSPQGQSRNRRVDITLIGDGT